MAKTGEASDKRLGLWDTVNIIVGIVIGAGIYETAPLVFANVSSVGAGLGVWLLGGALSLVGALCYAELASTYPRSGGDYAYLTRAFGPLAGFLFGWAQLAILLTGSIGMMAYVFADYAAVLWNMTPAQTPWVAAAAIAALTVLNLRGVGTGKMTQNVLSVLKVLGLVAVTLAGFFWSQPAATDAAPANDAPVSLGLAMILVLYTYGGWNDAAFVAAEMRNRERDIPKALLIGTAAVTLIYLLVNAAFLSGLGFAGARASRAIAADVLAGPLGSLGAKTMSVLVMVSALGATNGLIFTGSRVYASLGSDYSVLSGLGRVRGAERVPVGSLVAQFAVSFVLVMIVGTTRGRGLVDGTLGVFGLAAAEWSGHGGFDTLLRCTAPVFWAFFLMTGVSLFVLRVKDADLRRPFRVPGYPLVPLVFCGTCAYMLYSALDYAGKLVIFGAIPLALGIPLFLSSKRRPSSDQLPLLISGEETQ